MEIEIEKEIDNKAFILLIREGKKALRARGRRVLPQDNDILSNLYPNQLGWLVFIPDKEEK